MAHFAQLDENNVVINIVKISNHDIIDPDTGLENEQMGVDLCEQILGPGPWLQTSYNSNGPRRNYAVVGGTYDPINNVFLSPKPFPSWVLDQDYHWQPPTPWPAGGPREWSWDEDKQEFYKGD